MRLFGIKLKKISFIDVSISVFVAVLVVGLLVLMGAKETSVLLSAAFAVCIGFFLSAIGIKCLDGIKPALIVLVVCIIAWFIGLNAGVFLN